MRRLALLFFFCLAFYQPTEAQTPKVGVVHVDSLIQYLPEFQYTKSFLGHYQYMLVKDVELAWNDISSFKKEYINAPYISRSQAAIYNLRLSYLEYRLHQVQSDTRIDIQEYKTDLLKILRQQLVQELPGFALRYGFEFIVEADDSKPTPFSTPVENVDELVKEYLRDRMAQGDLLVRKQIWLRSTQYIHPTRIVEALEQGEIINLN